MFHTGQQIGVYVLIERLGKGGFGEVWLAERRSGVLTKKVAIKLPHEESVNLEAIKQEAELWEQVSKHENVLTIFDADIFDGQVAIISEYAEGGSLDDKLKHAGKFPVEQAVEMTIGILKGLDHLHSKNIVHRDIKPQNILLQDKTPRLADFGISRAMNTANISSVIVGTDSYMAPEALDGKRNVQTDIWSVGVALYQLLKGSLPFPQEHYSERMFAIVTKDFAPLPEEIPRNLQAIIKKALDKKPEERFKTADEMCKALDTLLTYFRNPTFAPTEIFSIPIKSPLELPANENNPSVVTKVPFASPPKYEVPPTQASPHINPTPQGGIVIERKAVENKTLVAENVGLSDADSSGLQSDEDNSSKSILNLTNENYPKWVPVLLWAGVGAVSGLLAGFLVIILAKSSNPLIYFTGAFNGVAIYLFGEYSRSPKITKRNKIFSLISFVAINIIGLLAALYITVSGFGGDIDKGSAFFIFGIIWGIFFVLTELLFWSFNLQKWLYGLFMIIVTGLICNISYYLTGFKDASLATLPYYIVGLLIIGQMFILSAHAIAFGKNPNWLISSTAVLGFVSLLIASAASSNNDLATNSNINSNAGTITATNGNLKSINAPTSNRSITVANKPANTNSSSSLTSSDYFSRGYACGEKNDYECAIKNYTKAIELTFAYDNPAAYNNRGNAYLGKGDYDQAIKDFNSAISLYEDPTGNYEKSSSANSYYNRGLAYEKKGNYDQAISDYQKALLLNPDYKKAKDNLDDVLKKKNSP